ncbi:hypothetical protein A11S_252 [Micavibrio aeruginosavorus EPB]|uniref:Uncharacterized protein n=2 Tax=Micavibrio aeruginosavorus TaxID=349221 RepID=M4VCZ9_9BACT|nr:hypothetical protein A11S_252 [Micavibrio aeruginosavorus EPB]
MGVIMSVEARAFAAVKSEPTLSVYNPLDSLTHLGNAVRTLDSVLDSRGQKDIVDPVRRDLVFVRNTLAVCFDIWQDDVMRRLTRSRDNIYVYSLTLDQAEDMIRRLIPGFGKAAADLRRMDIPSLLHIPSVIDNVADEARAYATNSRAGLKRALARPVQLDTYNVMEFKARALPSLVTAVAAAVFQPARHG